MKTIFLALLVSSIFSCSEQGSFDVSDEEAINRIRRNYVNGWLADDSETVVGLFAKDAVIIPSGLSPIKGSEKIENYWFPNDSSKTIIHSYSVELLDLQGTDSMAYSLEIGTLNFTYTSGDFSMTKESTSHATTVYKKNDDGNWLIVSRMWTSLNK
ncbi:YybH family protein [Ekhidna sp. To15]|uniref:YybH family protein n=1 Tax=Ekhidna sp. To15 TaxID=3395267 RepID=UPI003F5200BC